MKILYLDLETTGVDPKRHGVHQIAGLIEVHNELVEQFSLKLKPFDTDEIDQQALKIAGVTEEDLKTYDEPKTVYKKLTKILSSYVDKFNKFDKFQLVGYNSSFDYSFMFEFFKKCGDPYWGSWVFWPSIDVAVLAAYDLLQDRPSLMNFKLATVARKFGLELSKNENYHDAIVDIMITRKIFKHIQAG